MSSQLWPQVSLEQELELVNRASAGDQAAIGSLIEPWRKPLFGYIYRWSCSGRMRRTCCRMYWYPFSKTSEKYGKEESFKG